MATFLFCKYKVAEKKLKTLKVHFKDTGIVTRVHGKTKRLPKNATCFTEVETVKSFIGNCATVYAINLPGRVPGYKSDIRKVYHTIGRSIYISKYISTVNRAVKIW